MKPRLFIGTVDEVSTLRSAIMTNTSSLEVPRRERSDPTSGGAATDLDAGLNTGLGTPRKAVQQPPVLLYQSPDNHPRGLRTGELERSQNI